MGACTACRGRISGKRFRAQGTNGIINSVGRGLSAMAGFTAGEALTNKALAQYKEKNRGMIGAGKVVLSHVVAPFILPDNLAHNDFVQGGLDGFGVSGLKDVLLSNAKSFAEKVGISGVIDYGTDPNRRYYANQTAKTADLNVH